MTDPDREARTPAPTAPRRRQLSAGADGDDVTARGRAHLAEAQRRRASSGAGATAAPVTDPVERLAMILRHMVERGGSDLHLKVGSPPHIRIDAHLERVDTGKLLPDDTRSIAEAILPAARAEEFEVSGDTDFAHPVPGLGRFRVNVHRQRGSVGLVLRRVPPETPSFEALRLPNVVRKLADGSSGLVLVAGPAGSGRTMTVAAMIEHINDNRAASVVTIEDPIEVLHADRQAIISQREIGTDTLGYAEAMRRALRQDPDVIVVGDLRDVDTMAGALQAAETGQLVIATIAATTAAEALAKVVDYFPPHQHHQVRLGLGTCLGGIISQRLLERADGSGQILAVETLVMTNRIFDHVVHPDRQRDTVEDVMAEGEYHGMRTFDQSLLELVLSGEIAFRTAHNVATNPSDFRIAAETAGAAR